MLTANHVAMDIFVRNIESKLNTISEPKVIIPHFREKGSLCKKSVTSESNVKWAIQCSANGRV